MDRVLLISAVRPFGDMAAMVLGWRGWRLERAADFSEADARLRENPPDVVLLDLDSGAKEGLALCRRLKADPEREWPLIVISSSSRDRDVRAAIEAGCDDYLTKPIASDELDHKVEELLGRVDRRRFPRINASMQISFEDFKGIFFEYSRNLSRNGIFIEMDPPLPLDACLRLSFSLPEPVAKPVLAYGRVVRRVEGTEEKIGGVGVRFIHMDEESRRLIDSLVADQVRVSPSQPGGIFARVSLHAGEFQREAIPTIDPLAQLLQDHEQLRASYDGLRADHLRLARRLALQNSLCYGVGARGLGDALSDALRDLVGISGYTVAVVGPDGGLVRLFGRPEVRGAPLPVPLSDAIRRALEGGKVYLPAEPEGAPPNRVLAAVPFSPREGLSGTLLVRELLAHKPALSPDDAAFLEHVGQILGPAIAMCVARGKLAATPDAQELATFFGAD